MSFIAKTCYYFDKPGPVNTKDAARFAIERAKELGLRDYRCRKQFRGRPRRSSLTR